MTTDQKEKRNDEYNKYVKRVTPAFLQTCLRHSYSVASYALSDSS